MSFTELLSDSPAEVNAVNEFAKKKGLTAVNLPTHYDMAWACVDEKGLVKHWVHFLDTDKIGEYVLIDLVLWRAGRALYRDTGASYIFIIRSADGTVYYLAAPFATWEFGIDQDTLEPMAYVPSKFLVDSAQVEQQL